MGKETAKNIQNQNLIVINDDVITDQILHIRGQKVMLDSDLAELYGVQTFRLNEQVKRNINRFPKDFMFQLTEEEWFFLTSQIAISKKGRGGRRTLPYAFTEHGVLMLSSILNSERAVSVNIQIMRVFTRIRQMLTDNTELRLEIAEIKNNVEKITKKLNSNDKNVALIFEYIDRLQEKVDDPTPTDRKQIGYEVGKKEKD